MSRLRTPLSLITAGVLGAVTAVATTLAVEAPRDDEAEQAKSKTQQSTRSRERASSRRATADDARLTQVERRIERLGSTSDPVAPTVAPPSEPDSPPDADQAREHAEQAWQDALDRHARADADPEWARDAQVIFGEDIGDAVGDLSDQIELDCREDSCVASVRFASFQHATESFATLLQAPYRINCEVSVAVPEPEDPTAPYATRIRFVCPDDAEA